MTVWPLSAARTTREVSRLNSVSVASTKTKYTLYTLVQIFVVLHDDRTFFHARNFPARLHDLIHEAVSLRFLGGHEIVAVAIAFHLFNRLARVLGKNSVQSIF